MKKSGFTLLEILLVIGIIAILASIVILALNPIKMFSQVRNTQRKANLAEINKALYQYYIDNSGYPSSVTTTLTEICNTGTGTTTHSVVCTGLVDLSALVPTYLVAIPTDPQGSTLSFLNHLVPTVYATTNGTGYKVAKNSANKINLSAPQAELSQTVIVGGSDGVMPDHLVAQWTFDDAGSGTALDSVGTNNGTVTGATATTGVKGLSNTAYGFDGNDYIRINAPFTVATSGMAISMFLKMQTLDNSSSGIGFFRGSGNMIKFIYDNWNRGNGLYLRLLPSSGTYCGYVSVGNLINDLNWHLFTGSFDNVLKTGQFYLDGRYLGQCTYTGNITALGSLWDIGVGTDIDDTSLRYFNGAIDNVRIYNKALSAEEILNIYNVERL